MIAGVATVVRKRLGSAVYGVDGESIVDVVMGKLLEHHLVVEVSLDGIDQAFVEQQMGFLLNRQVRVVQSKTGMPPAAVDGEIAASIHMEALEKAA